MNITGCSWISESLWFCEGCQPVNGSKTQDEVQGALRDPRKPRRSLIQTRVWVGFREDFLEEAVSVLDLTNE